MYSVGILSSETNTERPYVEVLKKLNFQIHMTHVNGFEQKENHLDILLIDEMEATNSERCYETILKVRDVFDGHLILLTKNRTKTTDLVYLHLGIDGIVREGMDYEVSFIQLKHLLDRMKGFKRGNETKQSKQKKTDSLELNSLNISVIKNGLEEIQLTNTEYQMLTYLMKHEGRTLSYHELYQEVWGKEKHTITNYQYLVTNVVFKLRIKLGENNKSQSYIRTVRTKGYMFLIH
ncbi:hypothetical protein IGJ02_000139 [Enterococcus sp. DIV0724b]|uniref:winged helix-turn-helix domain-containing protein n=1 Tax=Enterococcus sp. DIV0724b TaxID=2774694 RepID=UPI003D300B5A